MKIFNQKLKNCIECKFYSSEYNICKYDKHDIDIDLLKGEIDKNCPFNKSLTKEDIESFGFEYWKKNIFIKKAHYINATKYKKDSSLMIVKNGALVFDGKITSKPHLEFILKSLNILNYE